MAKVVRFHETGGPEVLHIDDQPPREPGPAEVRINVEAIGLNRAEAMFRSGQYLEPAKLPARIGYEAAGRIDAVGAAVEGFRPGDAVSVIPSGARRRLRRARTGRRGAEAEDRQGISPGRDRRGAPLHRVERADRQDHRHGVGERSPRRETTRGRCHTPSLAYSGGSMANEEHLAILRQGGGCMECVETRAS